MNRSRDKFWLLAALLFAVHPLHTEVVNEVVGRSELLAAPFLLAACTASRGRSRYVPLLVGLCFLLALLAKEHAIILLALLPLLLLRLKKRLNSTSS